MFAQNNPSKSFKEKPLPDVQWVLVCKIQIFATLVRKRGSAKNKTKNL